MLTKELESTEKDVKDALKKAKDGDSKIKKSTVKDLKGALEKAKGVDSKDKKDGHADWSLSREGPIPGLGLNGIVSANLCGPRDNRIFCLGMFRDLLSNKLLCQNCISHFSIRFLSFSSEEPCRIIMKSCQKEGSRSKARQI